MYKGRDVGIKIFVIESSSAGLMFLWLFWGVETKGSAENRNGNNFAKICSSQKIYIFFIVKKLPQVIENTREIIKNMSEIF